MGFELLILSETIFNLDLTNSFKQVELYRYGHIHILPYTVKYMIKHYCIQLNMSYKSYFDISEIQEAGFLDLTLNVGEYIKIRLFIINKEDKLFIIGLTCWKDTTGVCTLSVLTTSHDNIKAKLLNDYNFDIKILQDLNIELYEKINIQQDIEDDCECGSCDSVLEPTISNDTDSNYESHSESECEFDEPPTGQHCSGFCG